MGEENKVGRPLTASELLARAEAQRPIIEHAGSVPRSRRTLGVRYVEVKVRSEASADVPDEVASRFRLSE